MLRAITLAALIVVTATPTWALTARERTCLFATAEKLPNINGLVIKGKEIGPVPLGKREFVPDDEYLVKFNVNLLGEAATLTYACKTSSQTTLVTLIGISE